MTKRKKNSHHIDNDLRRYIYSQYYSMSKSICPNIYATTKAFNSRQQNTLFRLESFVDASLSTNEIPFDIEPDINSVKFPTSAIAHSYFHLVSDFLEATDKLSPKLDYSERIKTFVAVCKSLTLPDPQFEWSINKDGHNIKYSNLGNLSAGELFNSLVEAIRVEWKSRKSQIEINNRTSDAGDCYDDYCRYVDYQFETYGSPIVLHINLYYDVSFFNNITIQKAIKDLNRLVSYKRSNAAFYLMTGYIAKLTWSQEIGFYWIVLFFFDPTKKTHSSGIHLAETIGNIWIKITKNCGDYHIKDSLFVQYNRSLFLRTKDDNDRYDRKLQMFLKHEVLSYLCYVDLFFRPHTECKVKLLRRGNYS